ncbi:hypothetical protein CTAM01_13092 [Colletotrichum tamarilloi]|uniref:Uncharacterized protein n=1 Tax=Colletotrichum tamarilloi TaxID=1209934 RepID=A0ABQ9QTA6_9PEZI|nr:uncharacterized protein CTAM01_13092 [Colletotrichum tamarilloi]KAK1484088.1 hypothetical protein CTAM01_13092 [Colletotrichum tamarilloi]
MLALESIQVDENSMDASGTSEPGVLNTTLAPASVTGLCYQNILRPRQRLCYQVIMHFKHLWHFPGQSSMCTTVPPPHEAGAHGTFNFDWIDGTEASHHNVYDFGACLPLHALLAWAWDSARTSLVKLKYHLSEALHVQTKTLYAPDVCTLVDTASRGSIH